MNRVVQLIKTAKNAVEVLDFERRCKLSSPRLDRRRERHRLVAAREVRKAIAAMITEIDTAVMQDLMQIVKKLSRGVTDGNNGRKGPADVILKIMEMAVSKGPRPNIDQLTWMFNTIYKDIAWAFQLESQQT